MWNTNENHQYTMVHQWHSNGTPMTTTSASMKRSAVHQCHPHYHQWKLTMNLPPGERCARTSGSSGAWGGGW